MQSKFSHKLSEITKIILEDKINYGDLFNALKNLKTLFYEVSEIDTNATEYGNDIHHETGKAIAPLWAGMCIDDLLRTKHFIKGTYKAIKKSLETKKGKPITLLYIGTGPFATLVLPLTTVFKPEELQLILVEVNPLSMASLKKCITAFGVEDYVKEFISTDAVQLKLDNAHEIDILLLECLQFALVKEQQVALTYNLIPQLRKEVILIPEEIKLSLTLTNSIKKMEYANSFSDEGKQSYYKKLNTVFLLDKETILNSNQTDKNLEFPELTTQILEEDKNNYNSVVIATEICIFDDEKLAIDDCSLTMCYKISSIQDIIAKKEVKTKYIVNKKPNWEIEFV
jgi:hypothetical protein